MFAIRVSFQLRIQILTRLDISYTASLPLLQGPLYCTSAEAMTSSQQGPKIEKAMICTSLEITVEGDRAQFVFIWNRVPMWPVWPTARRRDK